jgi:hypothetical protein
VPFHPVTLHHILGNTVFPKYFLVKIHFHILSWDSVSTPCLLHIPATSICRGTILWALFCADMKYDCNCYFVIRVSHSVLILSFFLHFQVLILFVSLLASFSVKFSPGNSFSPLHFHFLSDIISSPVKLFINIFNFPSFVWVCKIGLLDLFFGKESQPLF